MPLAYRREQRYRATPPCLGTQTLTPALPTALCCIPRPALPPALHVLQIQGCIDTYASIYLFSVQNMRNTKLKEVRGLWKQDRSVPYNK